MGTDVMSPRVNIAAVVNVINALSTRSLVGGNLCLMDDSQFGSTGQGGPELSTACRPGQLVTWKVEALDVQTPVEISAITFLGPDGQPVDDAPAGLAPAGCGTGASIWSGIVPGGLVPGQVYPYRIEVRMSEGDFSVLHVDTPSLVIAAEEIS